VCYTPDSEVVDAELEDPAHPEVTYSVPEKDPKRTKSKDSVRMPEYDVLADTVHALEATQLMGSNQSKPEDEFDEDDYVVLKESSRKTSSGSVESGDAASEFDGVTEAHKLEKIHPKISGMKVGGGMQGSAKLAKRTSKWVNEWNDRKATVSEKPGSDSAASDVPAPISERPKASTKIRGIFRSKPSKLKPSKLR
jgi:hypothetical protein